MQGVLFFFLLLAASFVDLKRREIPDWVSVSIAALTLLHFRPEYLLGLIPALFFLAAAVRGGLGGGDVKLAAAAALCWGCGCLDGNHTGTVAPAFCFIWARCVCCHFLKGRCGLHIQWLRSWPLDTLSLIMFRRSKEMKKKILSLLVLIGCVSVFCLRFRKKAGYLQCGKGN